jgi:TipAS antibiotic-recognition domain
VARWARHLEYFYLPSVERLRGLGQLYVADERFAANYRKMGNSRAPIPTTVMPFNNSKSTPTIAWVSCSEAAASVSGADSAFLHQAAPNRLVTIAVKDYTPSENPVSYNL